MALYRNPENGQEFNSGNLAFGLTMTFLFLVILSGALAAIPALFGWVVASVIVWLSGLAIGAYGTVAAYVHIRRTMKVDE